MVVLFYIACIVFSTKCYILCMYTLIIIFQFSMVAYIIFVWLQNRIFVYTIRNSAYFNFILIIFHDLYLACILQNVTQHCNLISNVRHYIVWPYLVGMSLCNLHCVLCLYKNNIVKRNLLCTDYKIG